MLSTILSIALLFIPSGNAIANPDCIPPCDIPQTGMFDPCAMLYEDNIDRQTYIQNSLAYITEWAEWNAEYGTTERTLKGK